MGNLWFELTGEYYKSVKKLESTVNNKILAQKKISITGQLCGNRIQFIKLVVEVKNLESTVLLPLIKNEVFL